ncbi:hypothetical protein I6E52_00925 [Salinibacterium sp. NG253]|uniref:hypothetical protein n=1 Tax=Salinibacterium sp. NG253 TaxID=2792039 RepID=UPI0018CFECED|nr:hypothetical protein [Salinibacterium sp. NG253]MBH0115407.1 hypothetical protein [Salinibacterium sp. NG253]
MSAVRSWLYVISAAAAVVAMLTGCTGAPESGVEVAVHSPNPTNTATDFVMSETPELLAFDAEGEAVLATSTNAGSSIDVSPFVPTTGRIAVYSDCVGSGRMTVSIGDVAQSSHDCRENSDDAVHLDEMDIDANGSYSIAVTTDNQQPWTVTVVALPPLQS